MTSSSGSGSVSKPRVTLIPGDGIGPEVAAATVDLLEAAGAAVEWVELKAQPILGRTRDAIEADPLVRSLLETRVGLKGPITTPVAEGHPSINVALRKALDLYANFRPVKKLPGIVTPFPDVDLIVVRENTESLYAGLEHTVVPGVVESLKIITAVASTRIARFAFEYARKFGRKLVTGVHKANIMKLSDGLFLECLRTVSKEYPEITYREVIVDNCCMQLVMRPQQFDVLLLENLYGDIISDLAAGLVGGLGLVPGANLGEKCALFEAVHGSAPDIAGRKQANPTALMLSAVLMLRHLGQEEPANRIERALHRIYSERRHLTRDVGGTASTGEFTQAIIGALS
ncbi:MAG TPA: isocitrate dehydrogenase (NAD(+)) [Terriglobia bacterium]|jgi:isocitrate dehydrogenase (NAD+)|nr:isocitrate dehydrogenase (NAD(+)) [Terriglobia bacterium]